MFQIYPWKITNQRSRLCWWPNILCVGWCMNSIIKKLRKLQKSFSRINCIFIFSHIVAVFLIQENSHIKESYILKIESYILKMIFFCYNLLFPLLWHLHIYSSWQSLLPENVVYYLSAFSDLWFKWNGDPKL